ncbi:MAG: hypothetical protein R3Y26_11700 [Rikenellaceae bacterium]
MAIENKVRAVQAGYKGEKGDDGLVSLVNITDEQLASLRGDKGDTGTAKVMSLEIIGENLCANSLADNNMKFTINNDGELIIEI